MADERKQADYLKWLPLGVMVVGIISGYTMIKVKVANGETNDRILFSKVAEASELAKKHDAIIPIVQEDMKEVKNRLTRMEEKGDRQYEKLMDAIRTNA